MQDSLPAGGLRLYREGVEPSGPLRKVSGHISVLPSRICPVASGIFPKEHVKGVALTCCQLNQFGNRVAYIRTSQIGVPFDPDRVYDAFKAGRSHEELHRAMMAGQYIPDTPPPLLGLPPGTSLGPPPG